MVAIVYDATAVTGFNVALVNFKEFASVSMDN